MYSFAPLGLLSLAGALRASTPQHSCDIYDLNRRVIGGHIALDGRFYDDIALELCEASPGLIGLMTECDSYHHILQICEAIKRREPQLYVVLGGPHASLVAHLTLERCSAVDAVVIGEGELSFVELVEAVSGGMENPIPGTVRRLRNGDILDGGARALLANLDDLPAPAWDLYQPDSGEEIFLEAGRGCPFQCAFCSTAPYWQRRHRVKSPQRLLAEMQEVASRYGTERVHLTHDLFTANRTWVEAVCQTLIEGRSTMRWTCSARTDTVDESLFAQMREAGCSAIYFGLESGSERMLIEMGKSIPLAHSLHIVEACRRADITPNVGFILGFPSEDNGSLEDTFAAYERSLKLGARPAHIFAFCAFAGASVYPHLKDLAFSGQLVDLPLGVDADASNRDRIARDAELYAAYYRPASDPELSEMLPCLDEFSPLVEATLTPALTLAGKIGGLAEVARRWASWVTAANANVNAKAHRRSYGSPRMFAAFLTNELSRLTPHPAAAIDLARYLEESFRVGALGSAREPTTMAGYRSIGHQDAKLDLGSRLAIGAVIGHISLEHDVLAGAAYNEDVPRRETCVVWHVLPDGSVRLLQVTRPLYDAIRILSSGPATAAEMLLQRIDEPDGLDSGTFFAALADGTREGLLWQMETAR
jgi:tRNA A37 methylthiotransferase MiaB